MALATSITRPSLQTRAGGTTAASVARPTPLLARRPRPAPPSSPRRTLRTPTTPTTMPRSSARVRASAPSLDPGPPPPKDADKVSVLMVCLGNICRSPSAEAVFRAVVERRGLADAFWIDSCGTGGGAGGWYKDGGFSYHEGDPADPRMTAAASARGVVLTSRSRPLTPADVSRVDYILAMDASNESAIATAAEHWAAKGKVKEKSAPLPGRVSRLTSYLRDPALRASHSFVPDPYYGGPSGFETVLDLLEDACEGLLDKIVADRGL